MKLLNEAHKAALTDGGLSTLNQLANIQPQGPLAYTTYDFLKHFAWAISIGKFVAHVCSLPLAVFLRRGFGLRYVDEVHIAFAFLLWQMAGTFTVVATGETLGAILIGVVINLVGLAFLPMAIFHRFQAKTAALRQERYSYYPGRPWGFWAKLPRWLIGTVFRTLDRMLRRVDVGGSRARIARALTHPNIVLDEHRIQGLVRRFGEPLLIGAIGLTISATGSNELFSVFLIWTGLMLYVAETLTQREGWEAYLDQTDAAVIAQEKERLLNEGGPEGLSLTHGVSLARVATPQSLFSALKRNLQTAQASGSANDTDQDSPRSTPQ